MICGGNDVIRSVRPSLEPLAAAARRAVLGAVARGAAPGRDPDRHLPADRRRSGLRPRTRERIERGIGALNEIIRESRRGARVIECVELADHPGCIHGGNYADDGIHPSASGHAEAARTLSRSGARRGRISQPTKHTTTRSRDDETRSSTGTERPPAARATMFATDFDALAVGDSYASPPAPIDDRDVAVFAALTGDHHPIHVDPEWAATGPFGRPIAHGLLVLSLAVGALPLDPDRVVALRRFRETTFKRPVAVGESVIVGLQRHRPAADRRAHRDRHLRVADQRLRRPPAGAPIVEILWRRGAPAPGDRLRRRPPTCSIPSASIAPGAVQVLL